MVDVCSLCKGKKQPNSKEVSICVRCNVAVHTECFRKKYNGESALAGTDFVCVQCASIESATAGHITTAGKGAYKRSGLSPDVQPGTKRARSNSRGRPAKDKDKDNDIMNFLRVFRAEIKQDLDENAQRIQKSVNDQLEAFRMELADVKKENAEIVQSVSFMANQYDDIAPKVQQVITESANAKENVDLMKEQVALSMEKLVKLEASVNAQAQATLRNNLVITGLAKTSNPTETFWNLVKVTKAKVEENEVTSVELLKKFEAKRAPGPGSKNNSYVADTILVRFKSNVAKGELIKAKRIMGATFNEQVNSLAVAGVRSAGDKPRTIFYRDHMTEYSMALFEQAKKKQAELNYKFVWMKNGQILMRQAESGTVHRINSANDLVKLPQTQS